MTELRKGMRVAVTGMAGRPMGTVTEVTEMSIGDNQTAAFITGAYVVLDDGRTVHRWSDELTAARAVLAPVSRLVWHAMRYGAKRVPDSTARVYEGNGIRLEVHRKAANE